MIIPFLDLVLRVIGLWAIILISCFFLYALIKWIRR